MNIKLHANCDSERRSLNFIINTTPVGDYILVRAVLSGLSTTRQLFADVAITPIGSDIR